MLQGNYDRPAMRWRRGTEIAPQAGLFVLGLVLGLSQLAHGAYDETTWEPIALGALAAAVALAAAAGRRPPIGLLAPLLGLWLWSLISSGWSDSTDDALAAANRWLLYAAAVAVLWWALDRDRRRAVALLAGAGAGILGVAVWMLVQMLTGHGPALFLGNRLSDPLGYVNGQAAYLLVGAWPLLALAERKGTKLGAIAAGVGMFGFVVLIGVGLLAQSRGWEAALTLTIVVLLLAVPGRRRRAAALLLGAVAVSVAFAPIADVWQRPSHVTGLVTAATTHRAAAAILLAAAGAAAVWMVAVFALERLAPQGSRRWLETGRAASAALALAAIAVIAVIAVNASTIANHVNREYHALVHLAPTTTGTRLLAGTGDRYDYWRVAMTEFGSEPLRGVGAGGFQPGYYLHRRTTEAIQQPHSLELQTLAELGLVGGLLLLAFLAAVAVGFARTARRAAGNRLARTVAVAAGGAFTAWLVQASVDWMALIPGLTAIALSAAAALYRPRRSTRIATRTRARVGLAAAATAVAIVGSVMIAPRIVSLNAQADARTALARNAPRGAITDATRGLEYDPSSVTALVLRSAGFARLHAFAPSLADLKRAITLEPQNWATWALLGDLLARRGDLVSARAAYRHALSLNPLEPELRSSLAGVAGPQARQG